MADWIKYIPMALFVIVYATYIAYIVISSSAIGDDESWENIHASMSTYLGLGLTYMTLLIVLMGGYAALDTTNTVWVISFILAVLAFGTAFGALAIASIVRS